MDEAKLGGVECVCLPGYWASLAQGSSPRWPSMLIESPSLITTTDVTLEPLNLNLKVASIIADTPASTCNAAPCIKLLHARQCTSDPIPCCLG